MLQDAKDLQNNAIKSLGYEAGLRAETTFEAPTGAGKTYMMAAFMDQVLADNPDIVFLVSSLSKADLAGQNYEQFKLYQDNGEFPHLNPYLINTEASSEERIHIPDTYNVYVLPRDLYKANGKLMQGVMESWLQRMTGNLISKGLGKTFYFVKDECHVATNNLDELFKKYGTKTINISATPDSKKGQVPNVIITEEEAERAHLIKRLEWGSDSDTLEDAIIKLEGFKDAYIDQLHVNPCLIVQISNKDKAEEEWKTHIKPVLDKHPDIQWMYIVDKAKECKTNTDLRKVSVSLWKKYAQQNLYPVDVIIFKISLAEGWDIKRACMLYQIRDTQSKQLDKQVVGRIRRNPRLLDYEKLPEDAKALADVAYVWGMKPKDMEVRIPVKIKHPSAAQDEIQVKTTRLKNLKAKGSIDIDKIIKESNTSTPQSIFELYRIYNDSPQVIKDLCLDYAKDYSMWCNFVRALSYIEKEYNAKICDYEKSMEIKKDEKGKDVLTTFPNESLYNETPDYITISNNVWQRKDGIDQFHFDSRAERDWAEFLKDISSRHIKKDTGTLDEIYLWGKNYLSGSEIKYEYYLDGIHSSYPDFILKDNKDVIHLFEVKSLNGSQHTTNFDSEEYKRKVAELEKCYLQASKLTGHIFYLPVLKDATWQISRFTNGHKDIITKEQFKNSLP